MQPTFDPEKIQRFHFVSYDFDERGGKALLSYAFDNTFQFTEEIQFQTGYEPLTTARRAAFYSALKLLHLFAGISYYKAAIPQTIVFDWEIPAKTSLKLAATLYRHGLGEFAFRNGLSLHQRIQFPRGTDEADQPAVLPRSNRVLVPVGGGKDSIVSIEALKQAGLDVTLFSVGEAQPIRHTVATADLPWLKVKRSLSPLLLELNEKGALNGHVPVTAIVSMLAVCTAILHGQDAVALSNERSANSGNLTLDDGFVVNHQYSKSYDFEQKLHRHIHQTITPDLDYFSLLRPYSELHIARQFARSDRYHSAFTSCNANFKINNTGEAQRWCLDCPKCRFVFLALAPFIEKDKLIGIFGANLLDMESQRPGYSALLGINDHKPFECVGEEAECAAALVLLSQRQEWKDDLIVRDFRENVLPGIKNAEELPRRYLTPAPQHLIPEPYAEIIHAYFEA